MTTNLEISQQNGLNTYEINFFCRLTAICLFCVENEVFLMIMSDKGILCTQPVMPTVFEHIKAYIS